LGVGEATQTILYGVRDFVYKNSNNKKVYVVLVTTIIVGP